MKKVLFVVSVAVLAFGAVACGESDPDLKCDATCNGNLQTNQCEVLNSALYTGGTVTCNLATCSVDTSGCTLVPDGSRQEFETCTPGTTAQGDCTDGLECTNDGTVSICFTACDPANDACGADRGCVELTGGGGICFGTTAARDAECLDNFQLCANATDECSARDSDEFGAGIEPRCTTICPPAELGTQGSCPAMETCLRSGWISPQETDPGTCTTNDVGTQGPCDAGFTCETTSLGTTGCFAPVGWCGTIGPLLDGGANGITAAQGSCDDINGHVLCGVQNGVGDEALVFCSDLTGGGGVCVSICEDDAGVELSCGNDGAGADWFCRLPAAGEEIYFNVQQNGTQNVTCTTPDTVDNCDDTNGFTCNALSGGNLCSRPYKSCFSTM